MSASLTACSPRLTMARSGLANGWTWSRYADSEGGVHDFARPFAWRYREWVINAFNADMPFDRLPSTRWQATCSPRLMSPNEIATGFHRNTITSREGGVELERSASSSSSTDEHGRDRMVGTYSRLRSMPRS